MLRDSATRSIARARDEAGPVRTGIVNDNFKQGPGAAGGPGRVRAVLVTYIARSASYYAHRNERQR